MPDIEITNRKIRAITSDGAEWAPFAGYSFLFDNPGDSLTMTEPGRLRTIDCRMDDPALDWYAGLDEAMRRIKEHEAAQGRDLFSTYGLCLLPPETYHCTAADGLNDENAREVVDRGERDALRKFLSGLLGCLQTPNPFTDLAARSPLAQLSFRVRFEFKKLSNWGNNAFVAQLKPADEPSNDALAQIKEERSAFLADIFDRFGVGTKLRFRIQRDFAGELEGGAVPDELRRLFSAEGFPLRGDVMVTTMAAGSKWRIQDIPAKGQEWTKKTYVGTVAGDQIVVIRQKSYQPHVSAGYFAYQTVAASTKTVKAWQEIVKPILGHRTIQFETVNLYAFSDMATFAKQ